MTLTVASGRALLSSPLVVLTLGGAAPAATQGVAYSFTPSRSGGVAPFTFSVSVGSIPAWASFSTSTGAVTGANPTTLATTSFTIRVTDSDPTGAKTADLPVSITVSAVFALTNSPGTTGTVGSAYSYTPTTSGGRGTKTWAVANLPSWAAFSTSTGALTGTPSGAETDAGITITGTDADGRTVTTGSFTITVSSGGGFAPSLDYSDARNSQYIPVFA